MTTMIDVRVVQSRLEAQGILSFELADAAGNGLPAFTAGAHVDVHLPGDRVRSYSLFGAVSGRDRYAIAVSRDAQGRGGSVWMHDVLRVGDRLQIAPPVNDFELDETADHSLLIAGGIGITPILAMAERLQALGRRWSLHYSARSDTTMAFVDRLRRLQRPAGEVTLYQGTAPAQRPDLARLIASAPPGAHCYCCGPAGMIDDFIAACAGRPAHQVHYERFAASRPVAVSGGFDVLLHRSGRRLAVPPGSTILDVLTAHDVPVQYACSAGVCGTCRTPVLDGTPDHRDDYLTDDEKCRNDSIMICCSGSRSGTLVLDL